MTDPTALELLAKAVHDLKDAVNQRFDSVDQRFDSVDQRLKTVEKHTSATNGRVQGLEIWRAHLAGVRDAYRWVFPLLTSLMSGGLVAIVALVLSGR